jgi:microcystin-dependent protein
MAQPFLAEIRMFGGTFAPQGWAFCNGQTLSISQNDALFALLGTTYGGDGVSTFQLPNLQGRIPMHMGSNATTGSSANLGQMAGVTNITISVGQMPLHNHGLLASGGPPSLADPGGAVLSTPLRNGPALYAGTPSTTNLNPGTIVAAGGGAPFVRAQPYLVVSFIIALEGIFPSRN